MWMITYITRTWPGTDTPTTVIIPTSPAVFFLENYSQCGEYANLSILNSHKLSEDEETFLLECDWDNK